MQSKLAHPPKIFLVNWFRKDRNGSFVWPGYGENMRVLKWIADRVHGRVGATQTAVGLIPHRPDLDLVGLNMSQARLDEALTVEPEEWAAELRLQEEFFDRINADLPRELEVQREALAAAFGL